MTNLHMGLYIIQMDLFESLVMPVLNRAADSLIRKRTQMSLLRPCQRHRL